MTDANDINTGFIRGQRVYNLRGVCAEFVSKVDGDFIVREFYEASNCLGESEEIADDAPTVWKQCFAEAPTLKVSVEVQALQEKVAAARNELNAAQSAYREFEREEKSRIERIKQHEELAEFDRILAGEVTHYVAMHDYYPTIRIIPIGETVEDYRSGAGIGSISLVPSKVWGQSRCTFSVRHREGRDSRESKVIPCFGEDDAREKAAAYLRDFVVPEYMGRKPAARHHVEMLIKSCECWGVGVPQSLRDDHATLRKANTAERIAKLQAEIDGLRADEAAQPI